MNTAPSRRPAISAAMYRPSLAWTLAFLAYGPLLFAGGGALSYAIANSDWPLGLRILSIVPSTLLAGFGLQLMAYAGHEGLHLSLFRNRWLSAIVGLFHASAIVSYFEIAFAMQHWHHHRYTNQTADHDIAMVSGYRAWWQRLLLVRMTYNLSYIRRTWLTAFGAENPFRYKLPFSNRELQTLARLNLLFGLLWIAVYTAVAVADLQKALFCIALPTLAVLLISSCQPYLDHAGTEGRTFRNAWSRTSWLMTTLYFGANYHLEHHLYPGVPCYRLPAVHRLLWQNGTYAAVQPFVQRGFLASYRNLTRPYEAGMGENTFDPFVLAHDARVDPSLTTATSLAPKPT